MGDGTPIGAVVMGGPDGRIRFWSAGAEELFGYTASEAVGQSLDLIVPEPFRARHWAGFNRAMSTGECKLDRAATNLPVRCKDGSVLAFPARFVFLTDARDEVVGAMGIYAARDGSEQPFGPVSRRVPQERNPAAALHRPTDRNK